MAKNDSLKSVKQCRPLSLERRPLAAVEGGEKKRGRKRGGFFLPFSEETRDGFKVNATEKSDSIPQQTRFFTSYDY